MAEEVRMRGDDYTGKPLRLQDYYGGSRQSLNPTPPSSYLRQRLSGLTSTKNNNGTQSSQEL